MGNRGILVLGNSVADTLNRLYYFERPAETYIHALQTGQTYAFYPMKLPKKQRKKFRNIPHRPCGIERAKAHS